MYSLLLPFLNVLILVGILFYYLRQPVRGFVGDRHAYIRDEVVRVHEMLQRAQARHEEFSAKLNAIEAEISAIRTQGRQDAEAAKVRIATEAKRMAGHILTDARSGAEGLFSDLRTRLRVETGMRVIERAERMLRERLTGDDRVRIRREFSQQVEKVQ